MNGSDRYFVWRRKSSIPNLDGYVSATTYMPRNTVVGEEVITFDELLVTSDWNEARELIQQERQKQTAK